MILKLANFLLLSSAETFILHCLLTAFLTVNQHLKRYYREGLAAYFVFQLLSYLLYAPLFSTAVLYFLFTMTIAAVFFTDTLQIKASVSALFVVLNYACKLLAVSVIMGLRGNPMPDLPQDLVLGWLEQITACLLFWSCVFVIIGFRRLRLSKHQTVYTLITYIVPVGMLLIVTRMFYHSHNRSVRLIYFDASGLLFCTTLALFYLMDKSVVIDQSSEQQSTALQLLVTQQRYYQHLEQFQQEMQRVRHDIKNHVQYAQSMIAKGEYDTAAGYLAKLYDSVTNLESPVQCGNKVVDIVLGHSLADMSRQGMRCDLNVLVPPALPPIDDLDLGTLFGNLLDNAVEACSRITDPSAERYVTVNASVKKGYLFVNISNSYNGELKLINNIYQTVKTGERFCGIGLSNVRRVVERYDGELSIRHDDHVFTVSVMLAIDC